MEGVELQSRLDGMGFGKGHYSILGKQLRGNAVTLDPACSGICGGQVLGGN
jgi:hypothetical protein